MHMLGIRGGHEKKNTRKQIKAGRREYQGKLV